MEWLSRMTDALEYMEAHINEPFDVVAIAKVACSSSFHFQRMFSWLTGCTVAEYVRRRKLTLAAQELAVSKAKVLDTALKYGYDTPESFAKAFRRMHGISPSAAREPGANLKAYPRISFQISLKGEKDMDYKIIDKEAFKVVGKTWQVSTKEGENFRIIPKLWSESHQDGTCEKLCAMSETQELYGICLDTEQGKEEFTYMIAVKRAKGEQDKTYCEREIPASTWAVFPSVGQMPGAIQKVWQRIYQEWFPATGYECAGTADLEVYPPGDPGSEDYRCEVWIPIIKK